MDTCLLPAALAWGDASTIDPPSLRDPDAQKNVFLPNLFLKSCMEEVKYNIAIQIKYLIFIELFFYFALFVCKKFL